MQRFISPIAYIMAAAVCIFIWIAIFKTCNKPVHPEPSAKVEKTKKEPPVKYKDKGGTTHTEKKVAVADVKTIKASYQKIIDSLTDVIKIKDKQLKDVVAVGTKTTGTFKPVIDTIYIDSIPTVTASFSDNYLSIFGVVNEDSTWTYSYHDSLMLTTYWKKSGFLKLKKTLMLDAFSMNPNTTIEGLSAIKISEAKPKKWAIGFNVSYGYDGVKWKPVVGVGINYNIIRF